MSTQISLPEETSLRAGHPVVSQAEWITARRQLLQKEKAATHALDAVSAERRRLPWVKVEKNYIFNGPEGRETLADLFGSRSQLIVYHFMFAPGWEEGCVGCSFISDHVDGVNLHLSHHDVAYAAVSRAPWTEFEPFKQRMGWRFHWVSSYGTDFNYDFHVTITEADVAKGEAFYNFEGNATAGEHHGVSVFYKDANGDIFHTYSTYARGGDILLGAHNFLDLTPKGRNEISTMNWVRHHDRYEDDTALLIGQTPASTACGCGAEGNAA